MNDTRGTVFRSVVTESQLAPTANAIIRRKLLRQLQLLCPFALQGLLVSDLFRGHCLLECERPCFME
jgi:hypothetical protein